MGLQIPGGPKTFPGGLPGSPFSTAYLREAGLSSMLHLNQQIEANIGTQPLKGFAKMENSGTILTVLFQKI